MIGPVIGSLVFIIALLILHNELRNYNYQDIIRSLSGLSQKSIIIAFLLMFVNYVILMIYEIEGFHYIKNPLSRKKIALTSFIAFAFSNNVGFYSISGSVVRYRLYSSWGLSSQEITKLVCYSSVFAFWLGLTAICGVVFLLEPLVIPQLLHLPAVSTRIIGVLFLSIVILFLVLSVIRKKPVRVFSWEFEIPSIWLSLLLIATAAVDWLLFAGILYVLLPLGSSVSFLTFTSYFLLAQFAALISHVPGGLGVFETVILLVLPKEIPAPVALGSLIVFRLIYYFIPLAIAAILLGIHESYGRRHAIKGTAVKITEWSRSIIPNIFAMAIFIGGIILLFSGATPVEKVRFEWLIKLMPLTVMEVSHFWGSIAGVLLLILSYGIYRRLDSAYYLTLNLLISGIVASLLKGFDYEEALILTLIFIALFPCKDNFYRKTSLINDQISFKWLVAILSVIACTILLGFFSYNRVDYENELWWRFSMNGNASRFLRATAGSMVVVFAYLFIRLIYAPRRNFETCGKETLDKVKKILVTSDYTYAQLSLLGDKRFVFDNDNRAFIMYGVQGASWISLGDPIGPAPAIPQLIWKFRELVDLNNGRPVFYGVRREYLNLYIDVGLSLMKLGEEARVYLADFNLEGGSKKYLRYAIRRVENEGWRFEIVNKKDVPAIIPQLKEISDNWLNEKRTREKKFSLGNFSEEYLLQFDTAVVRNDSKIVAFSNIWESGTKEELSVDLMRYSKNAPQGVMDYLFTQLLLWGKEQKYSWFNLGMAPFSGMDMRALAPLWSKLGGLIFSYGENFYNFKGLRFFKEKYNPVWEPKYLACPGGLSLPFVLRDIAALGSGGLKGVIAK